MSRHFLLIFWIGVFFQYSPIHADKAEEIQLVKFSFKTLSIGSGTFKEIYVQATPDTEPELLSFNRYNRSKPVEYEGTLPLIFFRIKPNSDPELPPQKVPVALYNMNPENPVKDLLLFIHKNTNSGPGRPEFLLYGMDDSKKAFPNNSIVIFNASGIPLHGMIHKKQTELNLGASKPFKLSQSFYTAFAVKLEEGLRLVYENTLSFTKDTRVILMVRPPRRERSIRFECYQITEFTGQERPDSISVPEEDSEDEEED